MKIFQVPMAVRRSGVFGFALVSLVAICWPHVCPAAVPSDSERQQIKMLIGSYYRAVADEDVEEVVSLYHWENSVEREEVTALVERAFTIADSEFYAVRVGEIDVYPERLLGLARVGVEYKIKRFDGGDGFSGHLDAAVVLVRGSNGWRIGKVGRAADFDLTAAALQYVAKTQELEETVPQAPVGVAAPPPTNGKLPKLAAPQPPVHQASPVGNGTGTASSAAVATSGGLTFFALRRKTSGECAVVAGAEGISPGDTVFGAFPDFGGAQEALAASCGGGQPSAAVPIVASTGSGQPLTRNRLYMPDDTITRGQLGAVTRIGGNARFAGAKEGGRPLDDGFFVHPGLGGPTEVVYHHDGSAVMLRGMATVLDCVDHCGQLGTVDFVILGDGQELWNGGLIRHHDPGVSFSVSLEGVHELRLITTHGGNGTAHDWAAWLDLEVGEPTARQAAPPPTPAPSATASMSSILTVPRYMADESTAGAFVIDLADGSARFVDRVKLVPPSHRQRAVNLNIFTALGRTADVPAKPGEILVGEIRSTSGAVTGLFLVDTSTGAAGYFGGLEHEPHRATSRHVNGRPAAAIASDDGNFALIMRRDGSGGTDGAYLYHATTGQCVYFAHVDEMDPDPTVKFTSKLPKMEGRVAAMTLQNSREATPEALLVDEASGAVYRVGALEREPIQLTVTRQQLGLFEFFPMSPDVPSPRRFVLVPGFSGNGATDAVFVIDTGTGRMAVLKSVRQDRGMHLVGSTKSLSSYLPGTDGEGRALAAVPKVGASGTTDGAWIFGSAIEGLLILEHIRGPHNLKIHRVERVSK